MPVTVAETIPMVMQVVVTLHRLSRNFSMVTMMSKIGMWKF